MMKNIVVMMLVMGALVLCLPSCQHGYTPHAGGGGGGGSQEPVSQPKSGASGSSESSNAGSSESAVFTVTYAANADGASAVPAAAKSKVGGSITITTSRPKRTGFVFAGWALSADGPVVYQPGSTVVLTVSVTLYAVWEEGEEASYTVKHLLEAPDGSFAEAPSSTQSLAGASGRQTRAVANEYKGFTAQAIGQSPIAADGSTQISIKYTRNSYTISFDANGGSGSMGTLNAKYDIQISLSANLFTRTGYTFAGWSTSSGADAAAYKDGADVKSLSSENGVTIVLYAVWKAITYKIAFDANGGTGTMAAQGATYDADAALGANKFKRTGFAFAGWALAADAASPDYAGGASVKNLSAESGATVTLYAVWIEGVYTITFNANGGNGSMADQMASSASSTTLNAGGFTRTGYSFLGWATSPSATSAKYADAANVPVLTDDDAVTLYAVWKANTYTITFDANGGTGSMASQSMTYDKAAALTANVFVKTGYTLVGWATSSSASSATYTNSQSVKNLSSSSNAVVTLYAVWKANTYTIVFNANGGNGIMASQSMAYDTEKVLPANVFVRTGYVFVGWATTSSATTATYTDIQSVTNLISTNGGTVTLYAIWNASKYIEIANASIGDIILNNGKAISPSDFDTRDEELIPLAVVAFIGDGKIGKKNVRYGVGVYEGWGAGNWYKSGEWVLSPSDNKLYSTVIEENICMPANLTEDEVFYHLEKSSEHLTLSMVSSFRGDTDGSDNWNAVCAVDSVYTKNKERYYPIFYYIDWYYPVTHGGYYTDWYMPTLAEMYAIVLNVETIDISLSLAGGLTIKGPSRTYWTSSIYYNSKGGLLGLGFDSHWTVSFDNDGKIKLSVCQGGLSYSSLVIRAFN